MELNVDLMGDCKPYFYNDAGNNINMTRYVCGKKDAIIKQDVNSDPTKYQKAVAIYLHSNYNSYPLEDAWNKFKEDFNSDATTSILSTIPQFLVIEEINRGNCAQIFGDIFQLLDRTDNGYSQYPIEADEDIQKALLDPAPADGLSFGPNGLQLSDAIKQQLKALNDNCPDEIVSKVCCGQLLVLPPNLHIWATMNTSDQSLFPIDSAFKRRWDWQYKPIQDAGKNWKIQVENSQYDWWQFIDAINQQINITTSSEDKKLGYFFCKPCEGTTIKADKVVNKVIFYLWNDVFKDYDLPAAFNYGDSKKKPDGSTSEHMSFNDFYTDQAACIHQLMKNLKVIDENATATPAATPETANDTTTTEIE
jgi:5-methylcytosine-specific restriction endonuclease McrBC GTP-binding regulatory subunit McrB